MAKTYKIQGYLVDGNGDDANVVDIENIIDRFTDLIGNLGVTVSPEWKWDDDCPENYPSRCTIADYERRFE